MRAARLLELLVRLQVRGGAPASELATELEVSVRTIYRDVAALAGAGVPVRAVVGRNGGIHLDPTYRVAGLPRLGTDEARGVLLAAVPSIADQLGLDAGVADRAVLPAMESSAEEAARLVRDRLLVDPSRWFEPPDEAPALADVARAVWESREVRLDYRGEDLLVQPLGLVLKGDVWYALARVPRRADRRTRLLRLSRVGQVRVLDRRFDRPPDFDLSAAWTAQREAFLDAMRPTEHVRVRIAPDAERLLGRLAEGRPDLPLPADVPRDADGWAVLDLWFEDEDRAVEHLLQLGHRAEVLGPPGLRRRLAAAVRGLAALYGDVS